MSTPWTQYIMTARTAVILPRTAATERGQCCVEGSCCRRARPTASADFVLPPGRSYIIIVEPR